MTTREVAMSVHVAVREQAVAIRSGLLELHDGESLCVHWRAGADRSPGGVRLPYRVELTVSVHTIGLGVICTRRTACTEYGPMTPQLRERLQSVGLPGVDPRS